MIKNAHILILLSSCLVWTSCFIFVDKNTRITHIEDYYRVTKMGDLYRIPLIYPYHLISPDGHGWHFQIDSNTHISGVERVNCLGKFITLEKVNVIDKYWFVFDTENGAREEFSYHKQFQQRLSDLQIRDTSLINTHIIWKTYKETRKLAWFPESEDP